MNKVITIYHGSNKIIKLPKFGAGNPHNDYGPGFYCTQSLELAREWAVSGIHDGYANEYLLDMSGLKLLNLCTEEYSILHWLTILLQNRVFDIQSDFGEEARRYLIQNFDIGYGDYDVMIGYRADDSYFSFAQDFLNNAISLKQLSSAMYLGELGQQVVLKSRKAFGCLTFQKAIVAEAAIWNPKKLARDGKARRDYFKNRKTPWKKGEIYMMQILDEEMKEDDPRLR